MITELRDIPKEFAPYQRTMSAAFRAIFDAAPSSTYQDNTTNDVWFPHVKDDAALFCREQPAADDVHAHICTSRELIIAVPQGVLRDAIPQRRMDFQLPTVASALFDGFRMKLLNAQATERMKYDIFTAQPIGLDDSKTTHMRKTQTTPMVIEVIGVQMRINAYFKLDYSFSSIAAGGTILEDPFRTTLGALCLADEQMVSTIKDNGLILIAGAQTQKPRLTDVLIPQAIAQKAGVDTADEAGLYHFAMTEDFRFAPAITNTIATSAKPAAVITQ